MNKLKFFKLSELFTLQDVKSMYKKLVYQYHPDRQGGDLESMKIINNEYELAFEYIKKNPINETEKKSSFYANVNDGFREILEKIIFIPKISIEIRGSWLWVGGETKPIKNIFKNAGFKWSPNNLEWYWKSYSQKGYKHTAWGKDKIRSVYGAEKVETQERAKVAV